MSDRPYMGSTGDQFAGADPRELTIAEHQLRAMVVERNALQAEVAWLRDNRDLWSKTAGDAQARVEQLEQALREARQFLPYEGLEQGPQPNWVGAIRERIDAALHPDQRGGDCRHRRILEQGPAGRFCAECGERIEVHPDQRETT